jgi:anti-sigma regulatory factor (Ser/Thr protein kinase)
MIQDGAEAPANGSAQVPQPGFALGDESDRLAMAAHLSHLAGGTGRAWLTSAAEVVGPASSSRWPSPDPAPVDGGARLPRIATCTPGADAGSVRAARDFTVATLFRWGAAERSHDIAIVVSELVTNALRHALPGRRYAQPRRPIRLSLLQFTPCLLCAVADPSTAAPVPRPSGSLGETGRGLHIVCALSDRWGYTMGETGKVVWAMFTAPLTAPPAARYPGSRDQVPGPAR